MRPSISPVLHDLRHAWRAIGRMPWLAAVVIVSLAAGVGVNTAVFTRLQYMVLQPLPVVADSGRLQSIEPRTEAGSYPGASWLEYRDLRERVDSFQDLIATRIVPFSVGDASRVERTVGQLVSGNFFSALGLRPAMGRLLRADEAERPGSAAVAVISYALWQSRFGGQAGVIGRAIRVNGQDLDIVGVAPADFLGTVLGLQFDVWIPATMAEELLAGSDELQNRRSRGYTVLGRLRPGVTMAQVQADVDRAMGELAHAHPGSNMRVRAEVTPFWRTPRGPQRMLVATVTVLQLLMLLVLIAICGNTATLMLTRAAGRQREMAVRLALGAGRWRIARAVLIENLLLALLGAGLGIVVAVWAAGAFRAIDMPGSFPFRFQDRVDAAGYAVAAGLGALCGLLFGAGPAAYLARLDTVGTRTGAQVALPSRLRRALMGVEVALALVVLVVAVVFVRGASITRDTDTGFAREGLLLATYDLTGRAVEPRAFAARVQEALRRIPGAAAAAIATSVPLDIHGLPWRGFTLEGRARTDGGIDQAAANTVTPGYFETMGIPFRAGRDFVDLRDATAPPQAIVNEAFVARYASGIDVLGRRLISGERSFVIAGVVATSKSDAFDEPPTPAVYYSYRDRPSALGEMHVRTRGTVETSLAPAVVAALREVDASLPIYNLRTMNEHIEKSLVMRRIPAQLFLVLGPMLLVLAAIGIYGVVAHTVASRAPEIGVRLALGATAAGVVREIVGQSLWPIGLGLLAGWIISAVIVYDFLREATGTPMLLLEVPALLLVVATIASWLPARAASRVDPVTALRRE